MSRQQQVRIVLIITGIFGLIFELAAVALMIFMKLPFPSIMPLVVIGMFMALAPAIGLGVLGKKR